MGRHSLPGLSNARPVIFVKTLFTNPFNLQIMTFSINRSIEILQRTPVTLNSLLSALPAEWTMQNEGKETWSVFDIIGHLIHGEETDWIPRAEIILNGEEDKNFKPFDRFAQYESSKGKNLQQLLETFGKLRSANIAKLQSFQVTDADLKKTGIHPEFGEVTLSQLIATWAVHDLNHIAQISRVMAKQYKNEVGPWVKYLRILNS